MRHDHEQTGEHSELYARLTVPEHVVVSQWTDHEQVEGYYEYKDVENFMGCDRLLRIDNMFGRVQLGYNPQKGQSFLFANIKTSRYDTASSRYNKELREYQAKRNLKGSNENIAYSAQRMQNSATLLYKADNRPWSERTVRTYLGRANLESLRKTMPFIDRSAEHEQLEKNRARHQKAQHEVQEALHSSKHDKVRELRLEQRNLLQEQNELGATLVRKRTRSKHFFRRLNMAFDIQKHDMFAYYRNRRTPDAADTPQFDAPPEMNTDE